MRETGEDLLKLVTASAKRRGVLEFLREGPRELREINDKLDTTSSAVLPQIRKLEGSDLVAREGKAYALTDLGEVVAENLSYFLDLLEVVEYNDYFWTHHDLEGIPKELRMRLGDLKDATIVSGDSTDLYRPLTKFLEPLQESHWVRGVSPIFHPKYPELFSGLVAMGIKVDLILTEKVMYKIESEFVEEFEKFLGTENSNCFVIDDKPGVAFTVSDKVLSLGLFDEEGNYDIHTDLISQNREAIDWGEDLFSYFMEKSKPIEAKL